MKVENFAVVKAGAQHNTEVFKRMGIVFTEEEEAQMEPVEPLDGEG